MKETFDLPEELMEIWNAFKSCGKNRETAVKSPFGFKRAIKYGKFEERYRRLFWASIKKLYPETEGRCLRICPYKLTLRSYGSEEERDVEEERERLVAISRYAKEEEEA